jgi:CheY-like chemotaxis protein
MNVVAMQGPRVLVVEDDAAIRDELADVLRENGYDVLAAENGVDALGRLAPGGPPSLIVLDLMMPIMDGWGFRAEQLKLPAIAQIPIVVITGGNDAEQEAALLGAIGYLVKPFKWEALLRVVDTCCRKGASPRPR